MRSLALLVLGGCESFFPLDSKVDATPAATCTTPDSVFESFDNPANPCANIGVTYRIMSNTIAAGGELQITPNVNAGTTLGGCLSQITMPFAGGAFVEVAQPIAGTAEYMFFAAHWDDMVNHSRISVGGTGHSELTYDHGTFSATTSIDRWWRMRPSDDGGAVLAETSPDGMTWTVFATDDSMPAPTRVFVELAVGTFADEAAPSTTVVEGINVCP